MAPPPADLDSWSRRRCARERRGRREPLAGAWRPSRATSARAASSRPIAPIDPNVVHPITLRVRTRVGTPQNPKKEPNVSLATGGSTFARRSCPREARAVDVPLRAPNERAGVRGEHRVPRALGGVRGMRRARTNAGVLRERVRSLPVNRALKNRQIPPPYDADVVKDACRRNSRWHALAILLEAHGRRPRGGTRRDGRGGDVARAREWGEEGGGIYRFGDGTRSNARRVPTRRGLPSTRGCRLLGGAVRRLGARRVGCDFATAALVRVADDFANRRTDDEIRLIAERHLAWIADVEPPKCARAAHAPANRACVPARGASRPGRIPGVHSVGTAEYLRAMMASFASGAFVRRGPSDFDAKDLHTKYALALVNAARDPNVACGAHRDHATELHNFLSSYSDGPCDAAVVARAIDPRGLTESDARGDLRGCKSLVLDGRRSAPDGSVHARVRVPPGAAPPAARRPRRGDSPHTGRYNARGRRRRRGSRGGEVRRAVPIRPPRGEPFGYWAKPITGSRVANRERARGAATATRT